MKLGPLRIGANSVATGRPGRVDGRLVYAIGDIHGCYGLLTDILAQLTSDMAQRARGRRPVLIFCGDYIDRGPQSPKVLDALLWLERRLDIDVHFLKGNHEQALLEFVEAPQDNMAWIEFGGRETLEAYGVAAPTPEGGPDSCRRARDALLERMPASHFRLLLRLELMVQIGDYAFVHAGVRAGTPLGRQTEDDLLWIREGFIEGQGPYEKIIVHGHTWRSDLPVLLPHRIGIDTGAYATGVLTALRLEDDEFEVIQARGPAPVSDFGLAKGRGQADAGRPTA